jgi:hypothetical protein
MMKTLSSIKEASTVWIKPQPINFFQHNNYTWLNNFTDFDIKQRLEFDKTVRENKQSCEVGKPTIEYNDCSSSYNSIFFSAAKSFGMYARKRGPPIVKPGRAMIWPGLSIHHHVAHSVPAWSMSSRSKREVFGRWIFESNVQCKTGSVDTSICAEDPMDRNIMIAVIPWLSGDYNPW